MQSLEITFFSHSICVCMCPAQGYKLILNLYIKLRQFAINEAILPMGVTLVTKCVRNAIQVINFTVRVILTVVYYNKMECFSYKDGCGIHI